MPDVTSTSNAGDSEIVQKNLQVGGCNAGRDLNIENKVTIATCPTTDGNPSTIFMAQLAERYKKEKENNITFRQTVERLEHFQNQADAGLVLSLEEKLEQGGRGDLTQFALRTKELFTKKLAKHSLYESAQEIHAFLLAEVFSRYHEYVYQDVCDKQPADVINARIRTQIIDPLLGILGDNVLRHYSDDINGMLYFLTGNCYIKWAR